MIHDFINNGYITGHLDFIRGISFDEIFFDDCNNDDCTLDESLKPILEKTYNELKRNYIDKCFPNHKLLNSNAWSGVDTPSTIWHNDSLEGFNSNIIVYLDNTTENTIEIKSPTNETKIYPKVGTFVWLNQSPQFLHRATHISGKRRVLSFELWI